MNQIESLRALLLREWIESLEHPASLAWDDFVYAEIRRLNLVGADGRIRRQSQ